MSYILIQTDGFEVEIERNEFNDIPTLAQFDEIAYYVDKDGVKEAYEDIISSVGQWVYVPSVDEDGDCEFYVDEGVYFYLDELSTFTKGDNNDKT